MSKMDSIALNVDQTCSNWRALNQFGHHVCDEFYMRMIFNHKLKIKGVRRLTMHAECGTVRERKGREAIFGGFVAEHFPLTDILLDIDQPSRELLARKIKNTLVDMAVDFNFNAKVPQQVLEEFNFFDPYFRWCWQLKAKGTNVRNMKIRAITEVDAERCTIYAVLNVEDKMKYSKLLTCDPFMFFWFDCLGHFARLENGSIVLVGRHGAEAGRVSLNSLHETLDAARKDQLAPHIDLSRNVQETYKKRTRNVQETYKKRTRNVQET